MIKIGGIELKNNVFLAPMSGVSDLPFRRLAMRFGAGLVFSEMVASRELVHEKFESLQRMRGGEDVSPLAIQLSGREPDWMSTAAKQAVERGADLIDINMGCPAKKVTRGLSGSALMRDLDLAVDLINATVQAVDVPVTLKMRLGWDQDSLNAPELARRAADAGVQMITVHGRTRCQFYEGAADWDYISKVKDVVGVPVIANGDIVSVGTAKQALECSNADGVMIGRGAYGAPWLPGDIAKGLSGASDVPGRSEAEIRDLILEHYLALLDFYNGDTGVRVARKHLCWYADRFDDAASFKNRICRENDPDQVISEIKSFFDPENKHAPEMAI